MEIKIINEQENPLFNRKEIQGNITSDVAPSKQEVTDNLSKKYSVPANAIRILVIKGKFGTKDFNMRTNVYPSQEERDNVEKLSKKEKDAEAKAEVPEEKPVEEVSVPAEETKTPAEEAIGHNPVEEAKKVEEKREEEDKKEKDKSQEEKLNETELQA